MEPLDHYRRIPLQLRIARALISSLFMVPIIVMYFDGKGVSLAGFLLIQGLFRATVIALEVPAGYVADRYPRHHVLMFGVLFNLMGMAVMLLSSGFWMLLVAEMLLGIAVVLHSGTTQALLYDALNALGERHRAKEELGRLRFWEQLASGAAMVIGGFLYGINHDLPVLLTFVAYGFAMLVLLGVKAPPRKMRQAENHLHDLAVVIRYAVHGHADLRWLMIYPALVLGITIVPFWAAQKIMADLGISSEVYGALLCLNFMFNAITARYAGRIVARVGLWQVTWLLLLMVVGSFAYMGLVHHPVVFIGLTVATLSHNLGIVVFVDVVNELLDDAAEDRDGSDIRATVLSVFTLMQQLYGMLGLLFMSALSGWLPLGQELLVLAVLILVASIWPMLKVLKLERIMTRHD